MASVLADFEGWRVQPGSPVPEALAALRALTAQTNVDPIVLGVTPVARSNPFQSLLYREFFRQGIAVAPVTDPMTFSGLSSISDVEGVRVGIHLHWLSFVLSGAQDLAEARKAVREFGDLLDAFRSKGGMVVWTVHNVLPHDATYVDEEIALRNMVAASATAIHVMSEATLAAVDGTVRLDPNRVIVAPHPSYVGAYPDFATRDDARLALGIEPDELVYVMFGAIKPYKGLDALLDAFDVVQRRSQRRVRLVVAGQPDQSPSAQRFVDRCRVHPFVLIRPSKVPAEHVQYYLRAADVGIAPYERVLNSGATVLYTTFGLPSVVPAVGALRASLPPNAHVAFDHPTKLPDALLEAASLTTSRAADELRSYAEHHGSGVVSGAFARDLRSFLLEKGERSIVVDRTTVPRA